VIDQPLGRRLCGPGFRMLTKSLAGDLDLADTQCGFKFFEGQAAREIFSRTGSTGFAFDVEVLTQARELGYAVKELPVEWTDRDGSTFRPVKHGVEVTRDLLRLRRDRRGRVSARR
ncbi:MAG: glycosyltransferase family 2 protein, partial [Acidimicrobiales bacterium]